MFLGCKKFQGLKKLERKFLILVNHNNFRYPSKLMIMEKFPYFCRSTIEIILIFIFVERKLKELIFFEFRTPYPSAIFQKEIGKFLKLKLCDESLIFSLKDFWCWKLCDSLIFDTLQAKSFAPSKKNLLPPSGEEVVDFVTFCFLKFQFAPPLFCPRYSLEILLRNLCWMSSPTHHMGEIYWLVGRSSLNICIIVEKS